MALFVFSGGLILISLSWAGSRYPWRSPLVVTFLAVGVFILPILGYWENSRAAKPIFPPSVFRQYSTAIHLFNVLLHGLLMWLLLHYLSLYYIAIKGLSPVQAGLWALPAILMVAPIAILVGLVVAWTGHYYAFLVGGWCLATASFLCLSLVNQESRMLSLIGITMLAGISFGALVPGMSVAIQATVNRADAGHAICMTLLMRPAGQALGIALGLTVFSTIFENKLESFGLVTLGTPTSIMRFLTHSDIMGPEIAAAMDALSGVWIMGGVVAFVAMVLTTTAKYPRLLPDGEDGTDHDEERIEMLPLRVQRNDEETGGGQDDDGVGSEDDGSRSRLVSDEGSGSAPMGEVQAPRPIAIRLR